MDRIVSRRLIPLVLMGLLAFVDHVLAEERPLVLAVHPYLPREEIVTRFTPLAEDLAQLTGRRIEIRVGRNYDEHMQAIGSDSADLAYIGPVPYVRMVERYGHKPLLARQEINNQPYLRGVFIVRQDSPLRTLAELRGKRFAFGDPESTMSAVLPKYILKKAGVPESALGFRATLGAHRNVVLAVLSGDYDAGAVKEEVYQEFAAKGLRVLAPMPPVADHLLIASNRLPPTIVEKIRRHLYTLKDSARGKAILNRVHPGMTALVPAKDSDYDSLRHIIGTETTPP